MDSSFIGVLGTLGSAFLGAISAIIVQAIKNAHDKREADKADALHEQEQHFTLQDIRRRLDSVEKKLDEHNHYASRFSEIEKSIIRIDERQASILQQVKGKGAK